MNNEVISFVTNVTTIDINSATAVSVIINVFSSFTTVTNATIVTTLKNVLFLIQL